MGLKCSLLGCHGLRKGGGEALARIGEGGRWKIRARTFEKNLESGGFGHLGQEGMS